MIACEEIVKDGRVVEHLKPNPLVITSRAQHESIILDAIRCAELGLDQSYEKHCYISHWKNWLTEEK